MTSRVLAHTATYGRQPAGKHAPLLAYLRLLAGEQHADRFLEIRAISPRRVRRSFVAASRPTLAATRITTAAAVSDVYVGVALRTSSRFGGKQAIDGSHLAFIECDAATAADALESFQCPSTMLIASGTPGHLHIYWRLRHTYPNEQVQRANRQLAHHLGGDLASVDIARVLRPPLTMNRKHDPPLAVRLISHRVAARYTLAELTAGLVDPQPVRDTATPRTVAATDSLDTQLRNIPTAEYVRVLTGRTPDRTGKISCPFHPDDTPSLQLYPGGTFFCFGCRRGGSIYDFASAAWAVSTRGAGFVELRRRLAETFRTAP